MLETIAIVFMTAVVGLLSNIVIITYKTRLETKMIHKTVNSRTDRLEARIEQLVAQREAMLQREIDGLKEC